MLRVLGSTRKLCGGMTRRDLLRIGGLGIAGMSLADLANWQALAKADDQPRPKSFGRAKSIILIHLYGAPSQIEFVDPKPNAPVEIRGELGSIPSSLPGCDVCELLPTFAKVMDRTTVLRSLTHPYPLHGVAYALTGVPTLDLPAELNPRDPRNWPFFGSVVDYVEAQRVASGQSPRREIPTNIALPFKFSSRRVGEVPRAGPYATFLGAEYDPVWTDYVGTATKGLAKTLGDKRFDDNDPYIGLSEGSHFYVPAATNLVDDVTLDRLERRKSLVAQIDSAREHLAASSRGKQLDRYRQMTYELLESDKLRDSLDLRKEDPRIRELYGHTLFGQSCLAARRLVEAGGRVVSVFWDEYGLAGSGWDTHYNHFPRMRQELCPGLDQAWYGLITDLDQRGLLDDTLVVCTSEHGRTPALSTGQGGGRDHWSRVYASLMAGGGTQRGHVVGASDNTGATCSIVRSVRKTCWRRCITCWGSIITRSSKTTWAGRCRSSTGKSSGKRSLKPPGAGVAGMLNVLGNPRRVCSGWTRRQVLQASGAGLLGLTLPKVLAAESIAGTAQPRAKNVIFLFLFGGPSQLETFDMKPDAPSAIRGPFMPIRSRTPELRISELMPGMADISDKYCVIRTMSHTCNDHSGGAHYIQTGRPWHIPIGGGFNATEKDWPAHGSVVDYLDSRATNHAAREMPSFVYLPNRLGHLQVFSAKLDRPGQYAGWLGRGYDPLATAIRRRDDKDNPYFRVCTDEDLNFQIQGLALNEGLSLDRLQGRRSLVEEFDAARRQLDRSGAEASYDQFRRRAMALVSSERVREALDVRKETAKTRDAYGRHLFGQSTLVARRLVEAGTRFVTVCWDAPDGYSWDSHTSSNDVKQHLVPGLDQALSALIADLDERGLLEETLVVALGEMGRTPKANANWGRDHWSTLFPAVLAGAGVRGGMVYGTSDRDAAYALDHPTSPEDLAATIFERLGIDPELRILDQQQRPVPLVDGGRVIHEILG